MGHPSGYTLFGRCCNFERETVPPRLGRVSFRVSSTFVKFYKIRSFLSFWGELVARAFPLESQAPGRGFLFSRRKDPVVRSRIGHAGMRRRWGRSRGVKGDLLLKLLLGFGARWTTGVWPIGNVARRPRRDGRAGRVPLTQQVRVPSGD
jgi:hypothetical protein